jgi:DNA-binding LacI/PurR family transcriptional regulator
MQQLAKRLGVNKSTISRTLKDKSCLYTKIFIGDEVNIKIPKILLSLADGKTCKTTSGWQWNME